VATPAATLYRLVDRDLLKKLMARTFDGSKVTIRQLADAVGCHPSAIGHLLSGHRETPLSFDDAQAIADRIGVSLLNLFAPLPTAERAVLHEAVSA
jgi:transcriptional regulator with XRE-family HTH domain